MVRTFLKVYMELSSYFLFLQEQIKDIIIITYSGSTTCGRTSRSPISLDSNMQTLPS